MMVTTLKILVFVSALGLVQEDNDFDLVKNTRSTVHYNISAETPVTYRELVEQAIYSCPNANWGDVDEDLLWNLVDIEKKYDVPFKYRGMLLAAACSESGYNPYAKGDHKFSKSGKKPMAIGILQLWPWYENGKRGYGVDRTDPIQSADAWMKHIVKQIPKVKRKCKFKTQKNIWRAAWAYGIRYPKPEGRCYDRVKHLRIINKWHKNIKVQRKQVREYGNEGC